MSVRNILASSNVSSDKLYVDDVFSAYTYTGNGGTQTINSGIDLIGNVGLVWIKPRSGAYGPASHYLFDTLRGADIFVVSHATHGQAAFSPGTSVGFASSGASLGSSPYVNDGSTEFLSLIFRKAEKFFDVVVYLGDGASNRKIAHSISSVPGLIFTKNISPGTTNWNVFHRNSTGDLKLNLPDAQAGSKTIIPEVDANTFTVSDEANLNGNYYVAYLFAHDPSADGIIQCGNFTTDSNGNATVNLGWEPQFVLVKPSSAVGNWVMSDASRGWFADPSYSPGLFANLPYAESASVQALTPNSTGMKTVANGLAGNTTYVYMAIRRPNKPPTSGSQVYNAIARTGTGAAATVTGVGFAPDLVITQSRAQGINYPMWEDRLRGATNWIDSSRTNAETVRADSVTSFNNDGISFGADAAIGSWNLSSVTYINHFFRRAPGFFDVVCYTGTGIARTVQHGLGVVPELMIFKSRSAAESWKVYVAALGSAKNLELQNASGAGTNTATWNDTYPTASVLSLGTAIPNSSSSNYVAYLFATLPGISKVGSYTGNGASQTINCGFATGVRFILIKRTDAAGDWYVWDSVRGIVAANDPHLSLNTMAAEVTTDDSVDPEASGFIVNQVAATNINVSGGSYIYLAIS